MSHWTARDAERAHVSISLARLLDARAARVLARTVHMEHPEVARLHEYMRRMDTNARRDFLASRAENDARFGGMR